MAEGTIIILLPGREMTMFWTFLFPFPHLSIDHPWIDSVAARLRTLRLQLPQQALVPILEFPGRLGLALGQTMLLIPELQLLRKAEERKIEIRGLGKRTGWKLFGSLARIRIL